MHAVEPGYRCEEGCGSLYPVPVENIGLPMRLYSRVPIEAVGVMHVVTTPADCPAGAWETVVTMQRFNGDELGEAWCVTGSSGTAGSAQEMHVYWCDVETLILCAQNERRGLYFLYDLDYFNRKHLELFGEIWLDEHC